jgi:hypothetical protein
VKAASGGWSRAVAIMQGQGTPRSLPEVERKAVISELKSTGYTKQTLAALAGPRYRMKQAIAAGAEQLQRARRSIADAD